MTHHLLLLRHAKSDWTHALPDLRRPLSPRGRRDAGCMGAWIAGQRLPPPDRILASPAQRVRETLERLLPAAGWDAVELVWEDALYLADADRLLRTVRGLAEAQDRVLLAGHNPGLEELLLWLAADPVPLTRKGKVFTTANLASLRGPANWRRWGPGSARLEWLVRPRELATCQDSEDPGE